METRNNKKNNNFPLLNNLFNSITTDKIKEKTNSLSIYDNLIASFRKDFEKISNEINIHENITVKEFRSNLLQNLLIFW